MTGRPSPWIPLKETTPGVSAGMILKMMKRMEETHKLLPDVQRALINQEFTFYAQPKCNMATGKIVGLEALIRWNHPSRGADCAG